MPDNKFKQSSQKIRNSVKKVIKKYHYKYQQKIGIAISLSISAIIGMLNLIIIVVYWIYYHIKKYSLGTSVTYWILIVLMIIVTLVNIAEIVYLGEFRIHHGLILICNAIFLPIFVLSRKKNLQHLSIFRELQQKINENMTYYSMGYFAINMTIIVSIVWFALNVFTLKKSHKSTKKKH